MELKEENKKETYFSRLKKRLAGLSFRTGMIVLCCCVLFYVISFAQMLLPISVTAKGVLWVIFYGLAKTAQYTALAILGKAGLDRLKRWRKRKQS